MKVVLSRKGFDSSYGGMASPILPDGRLISLPIPSRNDTNTLADLNFPDLDMGKLVGDLSKGRLSLQTHIHLDPDLDRPVDARMLGWRPSLGQTGAAQSHLSSLGIGIGDVFLFFGWFRKVEFYEGQWRYERGSPDLHVIFGWLEVGDVLPIVTERTRCLVRYPWIANHPHVASPDWYADPRNTLYIARERSAFSNNADFGGGSFYSFNSARCLTKPGSSRSIWSLPAWFAPNGRTPLTYHPNPTRWKPNGNDVNLHSAAKGQEFIINSEEYPELSDWVDNIIRKDV